MRVVESGSGGAEDKASPNGDASESDMPPSSEESSNAAKGWGWDGVGESPFAKMQRQKAKAKGDKNGDPEPSGSAVTPSESNERGDAGDLPPEGFRGLRFDSSSDLEDPPSDSEELLHYTSTGSKELKTLDQGWNEPWTNKPGWKESGYDRLNKVSEPKKSAKPLKNWGKHDWNKHDWKKPRKNMNNNDRGFKAQGDGKKSYQEKQSKLLFDEIMKKSSESEKKEYHTDKKSYHSPKKYHSQKRVYQSEEDSYLRPAKRYHSHEKTYTSSKKSHDDKGKSHGKHKKLSYDEIMKKSSQSYEKAYNSEEKMYHSPKNKKHY